MDFTELYEDYTSSDEGRFTKDMTGWTALQPVLAEITDIKEICKRLKFEMDFSRRPHIIERLLQKYNKLRSVEVKEAWDDARYKSYKSADVYREEHRELPDQGDK